MRGAAILGGLAFVAVAAWWNHSEDRASFGCSNFAPSSVCAAGTGLVQTIHSANSAFITPDRLPPKGVPGAIDPAVTQENIDRTICRPGYARSARPAYSITGPYKRRLMDQQYPGQSMADYELDHLIPISIGGAPFNERDLWLQPRKGRANAKDKNDLAYVLWRLVCRHEVPLATAQKAISENWIAAYQTYATPQNIAKYHFRHGNEVVTEMSTK
ncbi:hypothetical protein ACLIMP_26055 (plasmid) [Novosphingobium aerophilum]|uniref:hypothetical protein n=1 Tax=Novosphingobium aerophilum TaxID=2839843 RepID=UPI003FD43B09